ncbi:MAG TPA: hypothetical protein VHL05_15025 [Terriglobales bacterium]|jgi:hypothetical protein|nr:hypothetical protein [Terriglobales bacterium]
MNTVSFQNRGLIDLRAVRTFGVSAKDCSNPIGFFGTGLKYAIAICLRLGGSITLWRGMDRVDFATSDVSIRNADFRVVTMNGDELGFTTDLGKTWEAWQAFREIYCNTMDEGGSVQDGEAEPLADHTTIVVRGGAFYGAFLERDQIVITAQPKFSTPRVRVHDRGGQYAHFRSIRVAKLEHAALMTYDVLSGIELTEDRTLKSVYQYYAAIREMIVGSDDADLISRFLQAPEGYMETRIDLDCWTTPSPTFMQVVESLTFRRVTNRTALDLYRKHNKTTIEPDAVPLNKIERMQLDRAIEFAEWAGYAVNDYEIVVTNDLGEDKLGMAYEGKIYLNRVAFANGTKIVAGTLIEEFIHLRHELSDESRELQNHLLNALVGMGELARGEPL